MVFNPTDPSMQHLAKGPKVEKHFAEIRRKSLSSITRLFGATTMSGGKKFSSMSAEERVEFRGQLSAEVSKTREMLARREAAALEREARGEPPPPVSIRSRFVALAKRALRQARVEAEMAELERQEIPQPMPRVQIKPGGILKKAKSSNT